MVESTNKRKEKGKTYNGDYSNTVNAPIAQNPKGDDHDRLVVTETQKVSAN